MTAAERTALILADWKSGKLDAHHWRALARGDNSHYGYDVRFVFDDNRARLVFDLDEGEQEHDFPEDWDQFVEDCACLERDDLLDACRFVGILPEREWWT